MLNQEQLSKFKHELGQMKQGFLNRIEGIDEGGLNVSMSESTSELSTYDNHPADVASETFERSKDFSLREDAMNLINAVDHALDRIEQGKYGVCEVCGKQIPVARLAAIPYTTQCVDCKAKDESLPNPDRRPVEEDVLNPPFARTWQDGTGVVEFDGEDAWQSVAVFNEHAARSKAGAYYGDDAVEEEEQEALGVEAVENIPCVVDKEGVISKDYRGFDHEDASE